MKTVLIVEDDVNLRRLFRTTLTFDGYSVQEAGDGLEALRVLDGQPPDLVILDLGLPFISGHSVRQELAAHAHTRNIPILVITGSTAAHDDLEVDCLLRKPVDPDQLLRAVRSCLGAGVRPSLS